MPYDLKSAFCVATLTDPQAFFAQTSFWDFVPVWNFQFQRTSTFHIGLPDCVMCMDGVLLILLTAFDIFASSASILFLCLWAMDSWIILEYFLSCLHCTQFCSVCFLSGHFVPFFGSDQMLVHPGEYGFVYCSYLTWALLMYARENLFKKVMMSWSHEVMKRALTRYIC